MTHLKFIVRSSVILAALLLPACAEPPEGLDVHDTAQLQKLGHPAFSGPVALAGSPMLIVPFAVEMPDQQSKGFMIGSASVGSYFVSGSSVAGANSASSSEYTGSDRLKWNNIVFYDPASGAARLLLDHPALICQFHAPSDKGPVHGNYLLLAIAEADTNHDGVLGPDDAVRLYRADANGNGLRAVTPPDTQLISLVSFNDEAIYLQIRRDSDGDGKFTEKDVTDIFRSDPRQWADANQPPQLVKVIPDDLRARAFDAATKPPQH
jgi:hypothetical protein